MCLKYILDRFFALLLLILLAPVFIVVALFIYLKDGGGVFFRQARPGWHERPFTLLKFKTMKDANDKNGEPLPDDQRLTALGKVLRKLSLDEIPQLINVLKGEMSMVGPRPLLMEYLSLYNENQRRRHEVKPGITGWAQVNGRNAITWEEKFALDVWYVDHWSLGFDLKIIFLTFVKVFKREGISQEGMATMEKFKG
ncbi:MAG: sugar transferase [Acidobacteria bacterium]|jgi:lipopolysaccharide/colanic/teichoic acid biosynthesis glycosyltransferase|nr:sugar transferase [Acidobacteriota bacterium]